MSYTPSVDDPVAFTDTTSEPPRSDLPGTVTEVLQNNAVNLDLDGGGSESNVTLKEGNLQPLRYYVPRRG